MPDNNRQSWVYGAALAATFLVIGPLPRVAWGAIEEIVVTTRKKEEKLQDVPIAVSAISTDQIERSGVKSIADVTKLTPSLLFDKDFNEQDIRITIRGLSNTRGRSNVAFLVDGVDVTTNNAITAGSGLLANQRLLNDVERIEVVEGPQSALYGRSAFAGAISYITKEPGDELEGNVRADLGDYGHREVSGTIGGPVFGDIFGLRANAVSWSDDGYYKNSVTGGNLGGGHGIGASLVGVLKPTDDLKIKARLEFSNNKNNQSPEVRIDGNQPVYFPSLAISDPQQLVAFQYSVVLDNNGNPVIDPATGRPKLQPALPQATYLPNFGYFCNGVFNRSAANLAHPGICLPASFGSASGRQPALSWSAPSTVLDANGIPLNGSDFRGTNQEVLRASVAGTWKFPDVGTASVNTGWTFARNRQYADQDFQDPGFRNPYFPLAQDAQNQGLPLAGANRSFEEEWQDTYQKTTQASLEVRFASDWKGPLQVTIGGLHWYEDRKLLDKDAIIDCLSTSNDFGAGPFNLGPPVNLGSASCAPFNSWQQIAQKIDNQVATYEAANGPLTCNILSVCGSYYGQSLSNGVPWRAETNHLSGYLALDFKIIDSVTLTVEDRLVYERFYVMKPNQASCGILGFYLNLLGSTTTSPGVNNWSCQYINTIISGNTPGGLAPTLGQGMGPTSWQLLEDRVVSEFQTPKATINWKVTPESLLYASVAKAEKPGGINELEAGGCCINSGFKPTENQLSAERFLPEKMVSYEIGTKNTFNTAAGVIQVNGSAFYEDYTDKQVTVVELINGNSAPRVANAAGAAVYGIEFQGLWQPSLVEGLSLTLSYTWLDAKYTSFPQETQDLAGLAESGQCLNIVSKRADPTDPTSAPQFYCTIDLKGNRLEKAPRNALALSASLRRPLAVIADLDYLVEANGNYQSSRFLDQYNFSKFNAYAMMDLRAGLISRKWEAIAYVNNVFDDNTIKTGGEGPDFGIQAGQLGFLAGLGTPNEIFGILPDPRTFGLRLTYKF